MPSSNLPLAQVNVKRGTSYARCTSGQSPTANSPCEEGVVASDAVDGVAIQDRVRPLIASLPYFTFRALLDDVLKRPQLVLTVVTSFFLSFRCSCVPQPAA